MVRKRTAQPAPVKRRILIVDNHPLVRRGLKALIDAEPDLMVCAEAATQQDGVRAISTARPDLAVVDLSLGHGDGLELVKEIRARHADLRVLVLTSGRCARTHIGALLRPAPTATSASRS